MPRSVLVRAPGPPAPELWREEFDGDPLFREKSPDLQSVDAGYDPEVKERYQQRSARQP